MGSRLEEQLVFVLAMEVDEQFANLFEEGEGAGCVVDETSRLACCRELPADDEFRSRVYLCRLEKLLGGKRDVVPEDCFNDCFGCIGADHFTAGAVAKNKAESTNDDGFAGTGFACYDGESGLKRNGQLFNQCEVSDVKA